MKKVIFLICVFVLTLNAGNIGLVISTQDNPFFVSLKDGAMKQAKLLGHNLIVLDSQNDPAKELANVEDLIIKKIDVLLINPADSSAVVKAVKAANKAKIPVITLDRGSNGGIIASHIASDNILGGKMAGEFLVKTLKKDANIVELEGIPGTTAARDRGKGFNDAINGKLKIISKQTADFDRTKGLSVMENILQSNPKIDAVFAHNDEMALGAIKAIDSAKRKNIIVVGFDATDDAVKAVKENKMTATLAQKPSEIGAKGLEFANKIIKKENIPTIVPIELELITNK